MHIFKNIFILSLGIMVCSNAYAGGGWAKEKGKGYFKLSEWWVISDQHYTSSGGIDPNGTRAIFNTSLLAEYGITDRVTGILYFPFFSRALLNEQVSATTGDVIAEGDAINALGDTDLSIKYGLIQNKPLVVSVTLTLGLPTGNDSGGRDGSLQTGDGEFNQMLTLDVSRSFAIGDLYPYASVYAAFNNRTNDFSDEFRYGLETGITYGKVTGIIRLFGITSFQNGGNAFNSSGTSIFANNAEFFSFSPEIAYSFSDKFGISINYASAFSGKVIFADPSYSIGAFFNL